MKKAFIAMSGGVDSAVAAYLMREKGYECTGITMSLVSPGTSNPDITAAKDICRRLGIEHVAVDMHEQFRTSVEEEFAAAYARGETPNPCVVCNRRIKFGELLKYIGPDAVLATGHYARIIEKNGTYRLTRAADPAKDQSYFLYTLSQEVLARVDFPLGEMTKEQARAIAAAQGFSNADRHDSQDICFISDGDYAGFIEKLTGRTWPEGDFIGPDGRVLGRHKGIIRYTTGQRKGLGLALPAPLYVRDKDVESNRVLLCSNEELFSKTVRAVNTVLTLPDFFAGGGSRRVGAKIRYAHRTCPAEAVYSDGMLEVTFDEPQRAATRGQSLVLYDGDTVVAGGTLV